MGRRRLVIGLLGGLLTLAMGWGVLRMREAGQFRAVLNRAAREVAVGRHERAREPLRRLSGRYPEHDRLHYLLGVCEWAGGNPEAALAAWARVKPPSPLATEAVLLRVRGLLAEDRFAEAEPLLLGVLGGGGPPAAEARPMLVQILRIQGRLGEAGVLLRDGWAEMPDRVEVLRDLYRLHYAAFDVGTAKAVLESAGRSAPEDDRVWLGEANLAIRSGRFADAGRWLERCFERRPEDPAVWKARLDLARASGDAADACAALRNIPAGRFRPDEIHELDAWFAARRGDVAWERKALEAAVGHAGPLVAGGLERLIELSLRSGDADRAVALRARKTELDVARKRYEDLLFARDRTLSDPVVLAVELARLAEVMGWTFEARCWASLATLRAPAHAGAREILARGRWAAPPRTATKEQREELLTRLGPAPERPEAPGPAEGGSITPLFADEAEAVGLRFVFRSGRSPARHTVETNGGGVGLLDFDGDGWLDVYVLQGGPFPPPPGSTAGDRLFRNRGDGTFEDATEAAGLADIAHGYGNGVTVGDSDNDGDPDLFVTRWGSYALYRNGGDGTFTDVTEEAGLGGFRDWPTSAAFADLDGDGDLDLYVCHYLEWDPGNPPVCPRPGHEGQAMYCPPQNLAALPDHLFRNDGGRFVDVSDEAGIKSADRNGRGLGVVAADLDGDGRIDLYVANDTTANFLFRNLGGMRFEEVGQAAGVATSGEGVAQAGMGVDCEDYDGDGLPDLAVGNFYGEGTTLYRNFRGGLFVDQSRAAGLGVPTRYVLTFGLAFLDANNDALPDLVIANGHIEDLRPEAPFAMPARLLIGAGGGRMTDVTERAGPTFGTPRIGRGLARGDLDNDGRVDLVLVDQDSPMAYLHNRTESPHHWVVLGLEGTASNRDAAGARVTIVAGGRRQVRWRIGGGSYQSANDPRLHIGLADAGRVESIEVHWPSGQVDRFDDLPADAGYRLREGDSEARPLDGFGSPGRSSRPPMP